VAIPDENIVISVIEPSNNSSSTSSKPKSTKKSRRSPEDVLPSMVIVELHGMIVQDKSNKLIQRLVGSKKLSITIEIPKIKKIGNTYSSSDSEMTFSIDRLRFKIFQALVHSNEAEMIADTGEESSMYFLKNPKLKNVEASSLLNSTQELLKFISESAKRSWIAEGDIPLDYSMEEYQNETKATISIGLGLKTSVVCIEKESYGYGDDIDRDDEQKYSQSELVGAALENGSTRDVAARSRNNYSKAKKILINLHTNEHANNKYFQSFSNKLHTSIIDHLINTPVGKLALDQLQDTAFMNNIDPKIPQGFFPDFESPVWKNKIGVPPMEPTYNQFPLTLLGGYADHPKAEVTSSLSNPIQDLCRILIASKLPQHHHHHLHLHQVRKSIYISYVI